MHEPPKLKCFKELHKEIIGRTPKHVGFLGSGMSLSVEDSARLQGQGWRLVCKEGETKKEK